MGVRMQMRVECDSSGVRYAFRNYPFLWVPCQGGACEVLRKGRKGQRNTRIKPNSNVVLLVDDVAKVQQSQPKRLQELRREGNKTLRVYRAISCKFGRDYRRKARRPFHRSNQRRVWLHLRPMSAMQKQKLEAEYSLGYEKETGKQSAQQCSDFETWGETHSYGMGRKTWEVLRLGPSQFRLNSSIIIGVGVSSGGGTPFYFYG